jgi:hypothetical protein
MPETSPIIQDKEIGRQTDGGINSALDEYL